MVKKKVEKESMQEELRYRNYPPERRWKDTCLHTPLFGLGVGIV